MGTTAEKLTYLSQTKSDIRDAIQATGVDVPANTTFRDYATKVTDIQTNHDLTFAYAERVSQDGGEVHNLSAVGKENLSDGASLKLIPSGFKAGKLHSQVPIDGTGDFTVDRNSTATYVDDAGVIRTAQVNEPRFENGALLVEPQATNLINYSEDFSQWNNVGTNPVVLTYGVLAPNNKNEATRFDYTNTSGNSRIIKTVPLEAGKTYTYSIDLKNETVSDTVNLRIAGITTEDALDTEVSLTNDWVKYQTTFTASYSQDYHFFIGQELIKDIDGAFLTYGAQLEQGTKATSYIPTSGSTVTRLGDNIYTTLPATGDVATTFADNTTQVVSGTAGNTFTLPEGLIKKVSQ